MKKYKSRERNLHMVFIDLEKVHDRVLSKILWKELEKKGVCIIYIEAIKDMYDGTTTSVRNQGGVTKNSLKKIGLHQELFLSPYFFTLVLDILTTHIEDAMLKCMFFINDIILVETL